VFQNFDTFTTDTFSASRRQKQQLISMIVWENVFVNLKNILPQVGYVDMFHGFLDDEQHVIQLWSAVL